MKPSEKTSQPLCLSIFHTNDMHGHLDAMARLGTFARQLRKNAEAQGLQTFLWDAGDAADRRIQICSATKGAAFPQVLNAMGYSLQAMGNAIAITYGPQAIPGMAARSAFPILAANCRDRDGPLLEGLKEYEMIPLSDKITMGVIGLTAPAENIYEIFGMKFPNFIEVAKKLVAQLRSDGITPIVILSHIGLEDDRRLADEVSGIDLIIGGHSHSRLGKGEVHNGVLIAQTGHFAESLGRVDLALDPHSGQVLSRQAHLLDVPAGIPPDQAVLVAISKAEEEVAQILAQPIGELSEALGLEYFQECDLGNMTADALRERMEADICLLSSGQFSSALEAGLLTLGQLDKACFSTANPWLSEVRGDQLQVALERGLDPLIGNIKNPSLRGAPVGIPQISGMLVRYDPTASQIPRVRSVLIHGQPLEKHKTYRVAHTDVEIAAEIGCLALDNDQTIQQEVPTILREVMADYIRDHSPLAAPDRGRWIPI